VRKILDTTSFFIKAESTDNTGQTYETLKVLIEKLRSPNDISDDKIAIEFWDRLTAFYLKNENPEILNVVDYIQADGGFANMMCDFYRHILISDKAVKRYAENAVAVNRCIGISYGQEELSRLLKN
jgi:hypothetical protein